MSKSGTNSPKNKRLASQGVNELERDVVHQTDSNKGKEFLSPRSSNKVRKLDRAFSPKEVN